LDLVRENKPKKDRTFWWKGTLTVVGEEEVLVGEGGSLETGKGRVWCSTVLFFDGGCCHRWEKQAVDMKDVE